MNRNIKIVTIVGARPQFVKAAVISRAIIEHNQSSSAKIIEVIVHTGQHYDRNMSEVFFKEMQIPEPAYNLNVNGLSHGAMTGQMLEKIEQVLIKELPDMVLVYGDTNSTLAGAIAAKKLHIKVAHVEAGLRSFNLKMPEEINRILTDRISDILFCPTAAAVKNLKSEGYPNKQSSDRPQRIVNSGDVMLDAALYYEQFIREPDIRNIAGSNFLLATLHRAENTDDAQRLTEILNAFIEIAQTVMIIMPLHPRTKTKIINLGSPYKDLLNIPQASSTNHINLIAPASYYEMLWLLKNCKMVMTDSGGLQKEAFFFKKPCITLREETEWNELVDHGCNLVAGYKKTDILNCYQKIQVSKSDFSQNLYGAGKARNNILHNIIALFSDKAMTKNP